VSLHADLLAQARGLAKKEPRRPKQASLRRAVSAAYYALFHLLVDEATRRLIRGDRRLGLRNGLARAFVHARMKKVAVGFNGGTPVEPWKASLAGATLSPDLKNVAGAFVDLQQARHEADYDRSHTFTKQECLGLVRQAEDAFAAWARVRGSLEADVFLVALLAGDKLPA
jgi:hypothetical protein